MKARFCSLGPSLTLFFTFLEGVEGELTKSEDATHLATDGPAPRRAKFAARPAPSAVPRFLSGVKSPTRSSVTVSSNLSSVVNSPSIPRTLCVLYVGLHTVQCHGASGV